VAELKHLTRTDIEAIAQRLAERLFPDSDPAATFALLGGEERGGALLESALGLPRQPYYPDTCDKAAALMRSLMKNHPFMDGNKRTAVAATLVFLLVNKRVLTATQDELVEFGIELARSDPAMEWEAISKWLEDNSVSLDAPTTESLGRVRRAHPGTNPEALCERLQAIQKEMGELADA
jgi:death-on-curing protein